MDSRQSLPSVGDTLVEKYRLVGHLGAGGMGVVFAAEHLALQTPVAVKVLLPAAAAAPGAIERFVREARAAAMLRSEHVAKVLDVGTLPTGMPYLVMEHLVGRDLHALLRQVGRLSVQESVEFLLQVCDAVGEAHVNGIVHRDLKPSNLFVTSRPNGGLLVKVLDFGLAKVVDQRPGSASELTVTTTGEVIGSPHYMSPEQFRSLRKADARSDIWALGVIAYEILCGRRPFDGEGMTGLMVAILQDSPPLPRTWRPDLPPDLERLILRCLEKRPEDRVQSIQEMVNILKMFSIGSGRESGVSVRVEVLPGESGKGRGELGAASPDITGFGQSSTRGLVRAFAPKRGWMLFLASFCVFLIGGLVLSNWLGSRSGGGGDGGDGGDGVSGNGTQAASAASVAAGVSSGQPSAVPTAGAESPSVSPAPVPSNSGQGVGGVPVAPSGAEPAPTNMASPSRKGVLHINASPVAKVLLDGKPLGSTPKIGLSVEAGEHTVLFVFAHGKSKKQTVIVKPGQVAVVAATEDPTGGVSTPGFD